MNRMFGREIAAGGCLPYINEHVWFDLTAGDGVVGEDLVWERNCSPGLMAYHAKATNGLQGKRVVVKLYENAAATFDRLLTNLNLNLPRLGYEQEGGVWRCGMAEIHPIYGSGADASLESVTPRTAVLASNDPNAITTWAMRPTFAMEVRHHTSHFLTINTLGCNPGGLKRLDIEARQPWFDLITNHHERIPPYHDLILVRIDGDDSQWAYLMCSPHKWRDRVEKEIDGSFKKIGVTVQYAWLKSQPEHFYEMQQILFLTRKELMGG